MAKYHEGLLGFVAADGDQLRFVHLHGGRIITGRVSQDFFLNLLEKGLIYKDTMLLPFCADCRRFLPDRYVEGDVPSLRERAGAGGPVR